MPLHLLNTSANPLPPKYCRPIPNGSFRNLAFTLPEVLVSVVVLTIAVIGSIAAVNLIFFSIRGTETRANQNRAIDRDIDRIVALSEDYGACAVLGGSPGAECDGSSPGDSFYYFPIDQDTNIEDFETACEGSLADDFADLVDTGTLEAGVVRESVERVDDSQVDNHLIEITWTDGAGGRELRRLQVLPLVSAWCP